MSTVTSKPTLPLSCPVGYDMATAQACSFLINVAVDMCVQWLAAGSPAPGSFDWAPGTPCSNVGGQQVQDYTFGSALIWSTFEYGGASVIEPFGIVAQQGTTTHVVFRGTKTKVDADMDAETAMTPYTPPTSWAGSGAEVETGFLAVYQGLSIGAQDFGAYLAGLSSSGGSLILSGHSLGSTLATLAVPDAHAAQLPTLHYNQASPMVGNAGFASYYESLDVPTFRLVNAYDVVPTLPPAADGPYVAVAPDGQATFGAYYADPDIDPADNHDPCCAYSYALLNPANPFNTSFGACMTDVGQASS